ncbi:hypothetical protein IR213_12040 [Flavobacterium soyangense]|uniref:Uncharacterized protein n=2 Tax=Flavobacterium soyangense TaxID=2023265 RepID=A0A930UF59_9FLAO|nr:hypothetical protein [Flavobacterium soyangense]
MLALLLTSCSAVHSGSMENSASLSSANFSYVKQNIEGKAQATYVLGIGGLAKETLVNNAKQKMLAENPLRDNQTLANLTVNFKKSYYLGLIYSTVKCTVTADVVEFK